ncbi:alpha-L-rhamnosidase [Microbacterium trichothecenolyticum]|uniref:alpha-L-rhamnosidase n=1 Tax=Microbacterium trichothecenolyticum TaxID=69370 RepID=UPI00286529A6|nr:family 78 glycoside hydrolase catalytic domain [Microbacterium trichothecenolyticum]MDR7187007.1 alpha-L-rhamnosidase [Microbacterium trichothecenolyticum]
MTSPSAPTAPRFEQRTAGEPALGMTTVRPRLSWAVPHAPADYQQTAYELEIHRRDDDTERWVVESPDQVLVPWPSAPLDAREAVTVRVRVRGKEWSPWSAPAEAEAGLIAPADWEARFISPVGLAGLRQPAPEMRGKIHVPGRVVKARLFASAHGLLSARVNGRAIDDTVLAPGWTAYQHRLRYRAYDVTALVSQGENTLDVTLGNGWWRGRMGFLGERAHYGDRLAFLGQLEVTTDDGAVHVLATDESWRARATGILADDIYDGQTTDLRFDSARLFDHAVEIIEADLRVLVGEDGPPMRVTETIPAQRIWRSPSGKRLIDFGQNLVGWVRLHVPSATSGDEVVVRHAEVLDAGELGVGPLRSAKATDTYFLAGTGNEVLEPAFTFHGFRYAEIAGLDEIRPEHIEAIVIGSDLTRTGWFESSDAMLNQLHRNVVWGMRGNFLDVPTDCPQRDERLGWTGDIQVFSPTATYLFDTGGFLTSWLADLAAEQDSAGRVPHVVPDILRSELTSIPTAAWGDAATVVPWVLWERTGDRGILERQFGSMRAWVDHVTSVAGDDLIWRGGVQYGDWLDPTAPADDPFQAKSDSDVVATAHFARSADIVARAAVILEDEGAALSYGRLAERIRAAFNAEFVAPSGRIVSDAQTVYAMALEWDLLPDSRTRAAAGERLADLVRASSFRIATGFVGTPLICDALTNAGFPDVAVRLLLQTQSPSWLYPITVGATTIWERWDSLLADGTINANGMTSFNHYALGSVVDWVHRRIAGLAPAAPGYRTISVRPIFPTTLDHCTARHRTPYGDASVSWSRANGVITLEVEVPVGACAEVELADSEVRSVGHGRHRWEIVEQPAATRPIVTVRDFVDSADAWEQLTRFAVDNALASSDTHLAQLLVPFRDRPVAEIADAVWTRIWPAESTTRALAGLVANIMIAPAVPVRPLQAPLVNASSHV